MALGQEVGWGRRKGKGSGQGGADGLSDLLVKSEPQVTKTSGKEVDLLLNAADPVTRGGWDVSRGR